MFKIVFREIRRNFRALIVQVGEVVKRDGSSVAFFTIKGSCKSPWAFIFREEWLFAAFCTRFRNIFRILSDNKAIEPSLCYIARIRFR